MLTLQALYQGFASHKESQWVLKPENAKMLYAFVKMNDIKSVLDLGTGLGMSAAICALALEDKKVEYKIHTVEQNEKCFKLAQELIPEELRKNISFHKADPTLWEHPETLGQPLSIFKELPEETFDFIITDGPGPWLQDGKLIEVPNGDLLKLHSEGKVKPGTKAFFDGRIKALSLLERYYPKDYWLIGGSGERAHFLERREGEPKFHDERKELYEKDGYFV